MNDYDVQIYREIAKYKFYLLNTLRFLLGKLPFYKEMEKSIDKGVHEYVYKSLRQGEYESLERQLKEIDEKIRLEGFPLYNYRKPVIAYLNHCIHSSIKRYLKDKPCSPDLCKRIIGECERFRRDYESECAGLAEIQVKIY